MKYSSARTALVITAIALAGHFAYVAAATITGSGTEYYIPRWTGASTIGNSIIYQTGGKIGISTTDPAEKLDVSGAIKAFNLYITGGIESASSITSGGTVTCLNIDTGAGGGGYTEIFRMNQNVRTTDTVTFGSVSTGSLSSSGSVGASYVSSSGAGYIGSNLTVVGTLSKGGGSFKIDHPLDAENKYLYHSFVESPDMMNIYNGNATLDASGEAVVELPEWFEALNQDFRYQLTAIGAPSPNLYVAEEVYGNRFRIAGGSPSTKVSWQVTGIRHDPFAEAHRIPVEEDKAPQDRGQYLHAAEYGAPDDLQIMPPPEPR